MNKINIVKTTDRPVKLEYRLYEECGIFIEIINGQEVKDKEAKAAGINEYGTDSHLQ